MGSGRPRQGSLPAGGAGVQEEPGDPGPGVFPRHWGRQGRTGVGGRATPPTLGLTGSKWERGQGRGRGRGPRAGPREHRQRSGWSPERLFNRRCWNNWTTSVCLSVSVDLSIFLERHLQADLTLSTKISPKWITDRNANRKHWGDAGQPGGRGVSGAFLGAAPDAAHDAQHRPAGPNQRLSVLICGKHRDEETSH